MKRFFKRGLALFMTLALMLTLCVSALAADTADVQSAMEGTAAYICKTVPSPQMGSTGGEWAVIGLARSGFAVPESYYQDYYTALVAQIKADKGVLSEKKYTEYARVCLALTAIGKNPADVAGYNLLAPLGDFDKMTGQGVNGPIWALIALDSGAYEMPQLPSAKTQATRQMYVDEILSRQLPDGGWSLTEGESARSDPDVTGMALQALANYQTQAAVRTAVEAALSCLSDMQNADGGYASWGVDNAESVVQVIVALGALGVSPDDSRFVKNGGTLLDALLRYRLSDGSFRHSAGSGSANQMASEQGLCGLVSVLRAAAGKSALYTMTDALEIGGDAGPADGAGLPGKNENVHAVPVVSPGKSFDDIAASENAAAIEALAARGIIDGKGAGQFDPNASMTRAEFAAIVVRALGLPTDQGGAAGSSFSDVPAGKWYHDYITAASAYGIVTGIGNGLFAPNGTITRQEAAAMVARAARLCGMDTELSDTAVRDMLAQFGDYVTVSAWAQGSMAFCYQAGILDASALDILPKKEILRCEIAQMLFNLLTEAALI